MNVALITTMGTKASTLRTAVAAQMNQIRVSNYMRFPAFGSRRYWGLVLFPEHAQVEGILNRLEVPASPVTAHSKQTQLPPRSLATLT
jgi:hypothetical protein